MSAWWPLGDLPARLAHWHCKLRAISARPMLQARACAWAGRLLARASGSLGGRGGLTAWYQPTGTGRRVGGDVPLPALSGPSEVRARY